MVSFQALGTLMALGLMILPALVMRLVSNNLKVMCVGASLLGIVGSTAGLLLARNTPEAWGATIVVILGSLYFVVLVIASWRK